jgi:hypothetical protein
VIGTVAPDPALRVVGGEPAGAASAGATAPRKRARRADVKRRPALVLRAVGGSAATAAEPAGSVEQVEGGG